MSFFHKKTSNLIYTGIGSRTINPYVARKFELYAYTLSKFNFCLRSGGATGSDSAFERGCDKLNGIKEIYLPWKGFNNNPSELTHISQEAYEMAEYFYGSKWKKLRSTVKQLMARNCYQVLGKNLDNPSAFVVCYTQDGCTTASKRTRKTGGTGQAIAIADYYDIPIFNFNKTGDESRFIKFLREFEYVK